MKKTPTAQQESLANTKIIRQSILEHLTALELWGPMFNLEVNVPELFADDVNHTAHITWGCNKNIADALHLTSEYAKEHNHARLTVEFIGDLRLEGAK